MMKQIAVRLSAEHVALLDRRVKQGLVKSRAECIDQLLAKEAANEAYERARQQALALRDDPVEIEESRAIAEFFDTGDDFKDVE